LAQEIEEDEVYVDTGSLILNALISGTLMGGVSANKITTFSGLQGAGKTFFSLAVVKNFLDLNPEGYCLYFDTEAAVTKKMLETRGIDLSRVVVLNVVTIEEFRTKALKAVDLYMKSAEENRKPCMFVLDSLGMLSTNKEISDTLNENDKKELMNIINLSDDELNNSFKTLQENTIEKLETILTTEEDTEVKNKINETIKTIKEEKSDKLSYFKLKKLNESI
jgi:RecA/RadA recombinase